MRTIALAVAISLAAGGSAFAGTKPSAPEAKPDCETVAKLKADLPKTAKFTPLNISQFHFMEGVYVATPPASPPPPADNAVLLQMKEGNLIVWMKAECALPMRPTQVSDKLVALVRSISPVAGESSDAPDDSQDLHL